MIGAVAGTLVVVGSRFLHVESTSTQLAGGLHLLHADLRGSTEAWHFNPLQLRAGRTGDLPELHSGAAKVSEGLPLRRFLGNVVLHRCSSLHALVLCRQGASGEYKSQALGSPLSHTQSVSIPIHSLRIVVHFADQDAPRSRRPFSEAKYWCLYESKA